MAMEAKEGSSPGRHSLLGEKVKVYWPSDEAWYSGRVGDYDPEEGYRIDYDDGDTEWLRNLDDPSLVRRIDGSDDEEASEGEHQRRHDEEGGEEEEEEGPDFHPEELRVYEDERSDHGHGDDEEEEEQELPTNGDDHDSDGGRGRGDGGQAIVDTFSPLPSPEIAKLYHGVSAPRPFNSDSLLKPEELASSKFDGTFEELHGWTGHQTSTLDDLDALIEQRQSLPADHAWESDEEVRDCGKVEEEEAAVLEGHVGPAHDLPTSHPCFIRILYVESPGPNVLFACKTTVHQTEQCHGRQDGYWEWQEGAFRFEVLPPCPGDTVRGEVVMAVSEAKEGGTMSFLGQVVIDLASAAEPGAEKMVEGDYPLRTRKGEALPCGASLHVSMRVYLPKPPLPPPPAIGVAGAKEERQKKALGAIDIKPTRASAMSKKVCVPPRKWHNAINREKFQERLAKENKLYNERIHKIKPATTSKRRPRTSAERVAPSKSGSVAAGEDVSKLSIQIPGSGCEVAPSQMTAEALSEHIRVLQQEVACLKDAIKVGGAKVLRADSQRRSELRSLRAVGPAVGGGEVIASPLPGEVPAVVEAASWVPSPLLTEEALQTLEETGNPLVQVYRDRLARRKALHSKVDTFRRECERTGDKCNRLQDQIDRAERSRRTYSHNQIPAKGPPPMSGGGPSIDEARERKLQAEEMDLRVEIDALKSSKEMNIYNADLQHELRVVQDHIEQKRGALGEVKARLKTVKYDRDTAKAKYLAVVTGRVHHKLTKSVAALQLAVVVASKDQGWNDLIAQAAAVQAKASVTNVQSMR